MRVLAVIVIILGLAAIVFGILFIPQASSGEQEIADSVYPLTLDQVAGKYDIVSDQYDQLKVAEEPGIQAHTAAPSINYVYVSAQRALLAVAKANIGTCKVVRITGIVDIMVGLGLVLGGFVLLRKSA
jgi:hypothetical protein